MPHRSGILPVAALCLLGAAGDAAERRSRVYTNDDLARFSDRRGERPMETAAPPSPAPAAAPEPGAERREAYWRAEAERVRRRLQPWRDDAAVLRAEIASRQMEPGVRPYTDPKVRAWQRRLEALLARIREAEDRLEESARRAGALPGWLR